MRAYYAAGLDELLSRLLAGENEPVCEAIKRLARLWRQNSCPMKFDSVLREISRQMSVAAARFANGERVDD